MLRANEKIIALGYFDCVHIGHVEILKATVEYAENNGKTPCAFVLYGNGNDVFPLEERVKRITELGIREILPVKFDDNLKNVTATEFLSKLYGEKNARGFVCGFDFRYGNGAKGNTETLKEFCLKKRLFFKVVDKVEVNGEKVSTTYIKGLLQSGNVEMANALLSEKYSVTGEVVHGNNLGNTIDFPTANIEINDETYKLKSAVYSGKAVVDGKVYNTIINYGNKPTVEKDHYGIEAHLIDFNQNIYGKKIKVIFEKQLRDIIKFESLEKLKEQLRKDKESVL